LKGKKIIPIILVCTVILIGMIQLLPKHLYAGGGGSTLCNEPPQCGLGMTQCGKNLSCDCLAGWCQKESSGG